MDDTLSELLTCPSCSEMFDNTIEFKEPKVLPCQHVFCLACLQALQLEKKTLNSDLDFSLSETIPFDESLQALYCQCPSCSKKHRVPHDDVSNFDRSIVHDKLLIGCKAKQLLKTEPRSETDELQMFLKRANDKLQKKIGSFEAKFQQKFVDLKSHCDSNKEEVRSTMEELMETIRKTEEVLLKEIDKYNEAEEKKLTDTHEVALEHVKEAKQLSEQVTDALTSSQSKNAVHLTKFLGGALTSCDDIEGLTENVPDSSLSNFRCNIDQVKEAIAALGGVTNVETKPKNEDTDVKEFTVEENDTRQEEVIQLNGEDIKECVLFKDVNDSHPMFPILSSNNKWAT